MTTNRRRLILVGSRLQAYREYSLASLARNHELVLVAAQAPTWQSPYLADFRVADPADPDRLHAAVAELAAGQPAVGLVTWDEFSLVATADVAARIGLPHASPDAVRACRDKYATRRLTAEAGLPEVRCRRVGSAAEAVAAADEFGYPVVVKPCALGGSLGVSVVRDAADVAAAFAVAAGAGLPGVASDGGVLVEEYLDGPEISVDSVVWDGEVEPVFLARKRLGFDPYCEEVGHLVVPWRDEPAAAEIADLVRRAHRALGVDAGVTHAELRLTAAGPRLVELNGRLGGDLIPLLGHLATGVDLVQAAAAVAYGDRPDLTPSRQRYAEVRFLYPPYSGRVERLGLDRAAAVAGVTAVALAAPGDELRLPPGGLTPRTAALIAVGDTERSCRGTLDHAEAEVELVMAGSADALGAVVENPVTRRFLAGERGRAAMTVTGVKGVDWFRYGAGGGEALNRPVFLTAADRRRLEADLNGVLSLLGSIPDRLFDGDRRAFARQVGMSPTQTEIVLRGSRPSLAPLGRADLYREVGGFRLMEMNTGSSLGGWQMAEFAHAMMYDQVFRAFTEDEGLTYPDPLGSIAAVMRQLCPSLDMSGRPLLALTDWPDGFAKTKCWMDFVVPAWMRMGFDTLVCHTGDFEHRNGAVYLHGRKVDVIYRMFLPGEMADEQRSFDLVNPILDAVERGTVEMFAPLDSELYGNKGSLAMLSDERNRGRFSAAERELVDRVLPWTRFLRDEKVTVAGEIVDMLPYVLANRERLVLKPTLLYGGVGVTPGWTVGDDQWSRLVRSNVDGPYVIQERILPTAERFLREDGDGFEEKVVAYGVMIADGRYSGTLARGVADRQVGIVSMLNGAQIGCAFHVDDAGAAGEA